MESLTYLLDKLRLVEANGFAEGTELDQGHYDRVLRSIIKDFGRRMLNEAENTGMGSQSGMVVDNPDDSVVRLLKADVPTTEKLLEVFRNRSAKISDPILLYILRRFHLIAQQSGCRL
jgi:hypothetical protein